MSVIFGKTNSRDTVDTRPKSMTSFSPYQRPTYLCRKCQKEFLQYTGMRRSPGSSLSWCPDHNPKPKEPPK